ncbi:hypothetical protein TNIN_53861 [Trichonephila inaurata madagascariensis]|uniref:Uncharacterized protein n=1 Tax=Trichonephila inaurata madagascariensis TaxID=2747483 RepID=A0A8X6WUW3_9ARAC|nr:hypothetical protein TNIN_53861 [Trichonephila inaurata madagascariensis]
MISSVVDISNEDFKRCGPSIRWPSVFLRVLLLSEVLYGVDLILDFDGWIVRSTVPAPVLGDPGVWISVCTGSASETVLLWTELVLLGLESFLLMIWNQLPW